MQACPRCGFFHSKEDVKCIRCGALLQPLGRLDPMAAPGREGMKLRPVRSFFVVNLFIKSIAALRRIYYFGRRALQSNLPENVHFRNPWLAGLLGLLPGAGQLYNHQPKRALILFIVIGGCIAAAALTWYHPLSNYFLLASTLAWLYGLHDAFMTAKAINRDVTYWTTSVAFYFAWLFLICIGALLGQFVLGIFSSNSVICFMTKWPLY